MFKGVLNSYLMRKMTAESKLDSPMVSLFESEPTFHHSARPCGRWTPQRERARGSASPFKCRPRDPPKLDQARIFEAHETLNPTRPQCSR